MPTADSTKPGSVDHGLVGVGGVRGQEQGGDEGRGREDGGGHEGRPPAAPLEEEAAAEHARGWRPRWRSRPRR